ncbi:hypothetical protein [Desulfuribacillus alkaliarsenatis]|uniref:Type II secretion system protein GspG C-terminal domain-containing protein n=1 Tax=Desulfuribacillus alkaliarsenatis TaxID=766136 RepID=A0A1E5G578_9FIRM|nr:hypothetical protein [Desulfuribacillus alkaliarsenatis]OEF98331.1 hypothetical protein BHF68_01230 [Desulfuribacillus alkaliarsenatis]
MYTNRKWNVEKDKDAAKSKSRNKDFSLYRVIIYTVIIGVVVLALIHYSTSQLDERICENNLVAFRNAVVYYHSIYNSYPSSLEELQDRTSLLWDLSDEQYIFVPGKGNQPPELICKKFNRSSTDLSSN